MNCNCIETVEGGLADHKLDIAIMWSRSANTLTAQTYTQLLRRDNGKPERRSGKPSYMAHTFCPFCGERIDPAEPRP